MTVRDWIFAITAAGAGIGSGKTHHAASAAQAIGRGAVLVCYNHQEAEKIKREFPGDYKAVSVDSDLRAIRKPLVFDPDAFCRILEEQERGWIRYVQNLRSQYEKGLPYAVEE